MRKLSDFLLLPLLFLPARVSADRRSTTAERPADLTGGKLRRTTMILFRRVRDISRLFVPRPASEMHVIASAATADTKTTQAPSRRRRAGRASTMRTLIAAPRVRPQTT